MEITKRICHGVLEGLLVRKGVNVLAVEELVDRREGKNVHGALLQNGMDRSRHICISGLYPYIAMRCFKNRQGSFDAVLGRKEECLSEHDH